MHPLDQAVARFRSASLLDKPAAAEHAIGILVATVKQLEADLDTLLEQGRPRPPRCWLAPGAPS